MRLYYGTYGHHLSGKLYVYWGDDNLRTGEQVVAPVTNKRSGRTYNTMFTIARAQNENNKNAQREVDRLTGQGIFIKTIGGRDLLSLPGGADFETKIDWRRDSEKRYRKRFGLPEPEEKPKNVRRNKKTAKKAGGSKTVRNALKSLSKLKGNVKDTVTEKAKSALLHKKGTAADGVKQKERVTKLRQREAFEE